jgi:methyltransferase (TIGR00027 family)
LEIDQPGVLAFKDTVLREHGAAPRCRRSAGVDLRADRIGSIHDLGFDADESRAWIAEGLLPYLEPTAQEGLLVSISGHSSNGSRLAFDRIVGDVGGDPLAAVTQRSGQKRRARPRTTTLATDGPRHSNSGRRLVRSLARLPSRLTRTYAQKRVRLNVRASFTAIGQAAPQRRPGTSG